LVAAFPAIVAGLNRAGIGPLHADVSGPELRRAGLLATASVLAGLNVHASHLIFGHTHRAGPLRDDDPAEWRTPSGVTLHNTGCWVYEAAHLGSSPATSPYRPGFCAVLEDHGPPVLANLLDGVVALEADARRGFRAAG
jgi:hypothetical protein